MVVTNPAVASLPSVLSRTHPAALGATGFARCLAFRSDRENCGEGNNPPTCTRRGEYVLYLSGQLGNENSTRYVQLSSHHRYTVLSHSCTPPEAGHFEEERCSSTFVLVIVPIPSSKCAPFARGRSMLTTLKNATRFSRVQQSLKERLLSEALGCLSSRSFHPRKRRDYGHSVRWRSPQLDAGTNETIRSFASLLYTHIDRSLAQ